MAYSNIDKPSSYFNTVTYTGTGSAQSITVGLQPDWTWTKVRNTTGNHREQDSVRGTGSELYPNLTNAEATGVTTAITSWTSTGYNIGTDTGINTNGNTYVSWNWLGSNTTASNTSGTISSTVSANTTSGFSIVSYTGNATAGATVGHGLGVEPSLMIVKERSGARNWFVYHKSNGVGYGKLNLSDAFNTSTAVWTVAPSSTLFTASADSGINGSGLTYVSYLFSEVKGYSKFGKYTGNGSTDGTFVYTGMRPAFVMIKRTDVTDQWYIIDNKRSSINSTNHRLFANLSDAESTGSNIDILSNGFKSRTSDATNNASGGSYIYMAFAENPFVSSKSIPTTAR
jgi:hypothetical protein